MDKRSLASRDDDERNASSFLGESCYPVHRYEPCRFSVFRRRQPSKASDCFFSNTDASEPIHTSDVETEFNRRDLWTSSTTDELHPPSTSDLRQVPKDQDLAPADLTPASASNSKENSQPQAGSISNLRQIPKDQDSALADLTPASISNSKENSQPQAGSMSMPNPVLDPKLPIRPLQSSSSVRHTSSSLVDAIAHLSSMNQEPLRPPTFEFEWSSSAAEQNHSILKQNNFDVAASIASQHTSPVSFGSEFKSVSSLRSLLGHHPLWNGIFNSLSFGVDFPLKSMS